MPQHFHPAGQRCRGRKWQEYDPTMCPPKSPMPLVIQVAHPQTAGKAPWGALPFPWWQVDSLGPTTAHSPIPGASCTQSPVRPGRPRQRCPFVLVPAAWLQGSALSWPSPRDASITGAGPLGSQGLRTNYRLCTELRPLIPQNGSHGSDMLARRARTSMSPGLGVQTPAFYPDCHLLAPGQF